MFKLMGKEINAILGAQTILIWTYANSEIHAASEVVLWKIYSLKWKLWLLISLAQKGQLIWIYTDFKEDKECQINKKMLVPSPHCLDTSYVLDIGILDISLNVIRCLKLISRVLGFMDQ